MRSYSLSGSDSYIKTPSKIVNSIFYAFIVLGLSALACNLGRPASTPSKPGVVIDSPASGSQFHEGDTVSVQSTSDDPQGIQRVTLIVDGATVSDNTLPSPQTHFTLVQNWTAVAGNHSISVQAYNINGGLSDSAEISVDVTQSEATAQTPIGPTLVTETPTVAPTDTPANTPLPANTSIPAGPAPLDFSGHWFTNFGTLDIVQNGRDVTGTYYNGFLTTTGSITGSVSGDHLSGSLPGSPDPKIDLTLGSGGLTFDGQRIGGGTQSGKWCGAKPGHHFPNGCSFSGQWMILREPANADCDTSPLTLVRQDETVSGEYCNNRPIMGTIKYNAGGETILQGTLLNQDGSGTKPLTFFLVDLNGNQFQGNWDGTWEFCGWRSGLSQPTYCKRP
jgi:hypothetical protein